MDDECCMLSTFRREPFPEKLLEALASIYGNPNPRFTVHFWCQEIISSGAGGSSSVKLCLNNLIVEIDRLQNRVVHPFCHPCLLIAPKLDYEFPHIRGCRYWMM
jgi:hypothetical protein